MMEDVVRFLLTKYGQHVDDPQQVINSDETKIRTELTLMDKKLRNTKIVGIFWAVIGLMWIALSAVKLYEQTSYPVLTYVQIGMAVIYVGIGISSFNQFRILEKRKLILETILFIREQGQSPIA